MRAAASRVSRTAVACIALLALAVGLVACGDEEEEAQKITFTVSGEGKAVKITGPKSAETGLAEITLENEGKGEGELQLIRVEGDHSTEEVIEGFGKAVESEPLPEWLFAGGGVSSTGSGGSQTVTQVLQPGTYYAFNTANSAPNPKTLPAMKVEGEESDETVDGDVTVTAVDYGFEVDEIPAGKTELALENAGAQPHHLLAAPLNGENTAEDAEKFFKSNEGKPPFEEEETQSTAVIEGGEGQLVTLDLKPGRYVLFCFIADRQGGPPHAVKGMVDEVEVE